MMNTSNSALSRIKEYSKYSTRVVANSLRAVDMGGLLAASIKPVATLLKSSIGCYPRKRIRPTILCGSRILISVTRSSK